MSLKSQRLAQSAYKQIDARRQRPEKYRKEYRSFAREFPTLVHQCGLAQAVAFAQAKKDHQGDYVSDLAAVLKEVGHEVSNVESRWPDKPDRSLCPATFASAETRSTRPFG